MNIKITFQSNYNGWYIEGVEDETLVKKLEEDLVEYSHSLYDGDDLCGEVDVEECIKIVQKHVPNSVVEFEEDPYST